MKPFLGSSDERQCKNCSIARVGQDWLFLGISPLLVVETPLFPLYLCSNVTQHSDALQPAEVLACSAAGAGAARHHSVPIVRMLYAPYPTPWSKLRTKKAQNKNQEWRSGGRGAVAQQPDPQEEIIETRLQFVLGTGGAGDVLMAALQGRGHQKMVFWYKTSLL